MIVPITSSLREGETIQSKQREGKMKKLAVVLFVLLSLVASVSFATFQHPKKGSSPTELPVASTVCNDGSQSPSCRCN